MSDAVSDMLAGGSLQRAYKSERKRLIAGRAGPIRWAIEAKGPALDLLLDKNRKELVGQSLRQACFAWGKVFLPKRFSHYVERRPFPYPRHRLGFFLGKARRMGIVKAIIQRLSTTRGWDPWKPDRPPFQLIIEWKKMHPGKYQAGPNETNLICDMRKNAKRMVMEIIEEMWEDGKFIPLVESGTARAKATMGFKIRTVVNNTKQEATIRIPFGHPTASTVGATVRTLPTWEVAWIAKRLDEQLEARLNQRGLSVGRDGVLTTRAAPPVQSRAFAPGFGGVRE